jgi:hypothetical protein
MIQRPETGQATQSHIKATPKRVDSQGIGTLKPPQCDPKATFMRPTSHPGANAEGRMQNAEWPSEAAQSQPKAMGMCQ